MSLNANAKKGAAEFVYGGGVAFDLSNGGTNSNRLALNLSHIDGYNGIEDDQRVELSWSFGFGSGPVGQTESAGLAESTGRIRAAADVVETAPGNELLGDVMQRPSFLPERVIARSARSSFCSTVVPHSFVNGAPAGPDAVSMVPGQVAVVLIPDTPPGAFDQSVVKIGENAASYLGSAYSYRFYITENLQGLVIGQPSTVSVILASETRSIPVQVIPAVTR